MSWTAGTWKAVAIGDTVLGGDGYPWRVTGALVERWAPDGEIAMLRATMERDGAGSRTGSVRTSKEIKYEPADPRGALLSCDACLRDAEPCAYHAQTGSADRVITQSPDVPEMTKRPNDCRSDQSEKDCLPCDKQSQGETRGRSADAQLSTSDTIEPTGSQQEATKNSVTSCRKCDADTHACRGCGEPLPHGTVACAGCNRSNVPNHPAGDVGAVPKSSSPSSARPPSLVGEPISSSSSLTHSPDRPYVEYDDEERAAASALRGHFEVKVIERVMTLEGLTSHLGDTHGHALPERGPLIGVEYRAVLADLHFELHAADQVAGEKWKPRGRTPHTHPVMDRPMENPIPRAWAKSLQKS